MSILPKDIRRFCFHNLYGIFATELIELVASFFQQEFEGLLVRNIILTQSYSDIIALNNEEFIASNTKGIFYENVITQTNIHLSHAKLNLLSICLIDLKWTIVNTFSCKDGVFLFDKENLKLIENEEQAPEHLKWIFEFFHITRTKTKNGDVYLLKGIAPENVVTLVDCDPTIYFKTKDVHEEKIVDHPMYDISSGILHIQLAFDGSIFHITKDPHRLYKNNVLFNSFEDRWVVNMVVLSQNNILVEFDDNFEIYNQNGKLEHILSLPNLFYVTQFENGDLLFLDDDNNLHRFHDGTFEKIGSPIFPHYDCHLYVQLFDNNQIFISCKHLTQILK